MGNTTSAAESVEIVACRRRIERRCRLDGVYGRPLALLLGYRSVRSYQRAAQNGTLPNVPLHPLPGRKGSYARTADLAVWVVARAKSSNPPASWERLVDEAFDAR